MARKEREWWKEIAEIHRVDIGNTSMKILSEDAAVYAVITNEEGEKVNGK